jgi:hypothetical protein
MADDEQDDDAIAEIFQCQGPPVCTVKDEDLEKVMPTCPMCTRMVVYRDGPGDVTEGTLKCKN